MRMYGKQARHALHHHLANVVLGLADQCDARTAILKRDAAHPFGTGARLARAAPTEDQPGQPRLAIIGGHWRALVSVGEKAEIAEQMPQLIRRDRRQHVALTAPIQRRPIL